MVTEYKYTYYQYSTRFPKRPYRIRIKLNGITYEDRYSDKKEAAKAVDILLIKNNQQPVNILIKKPKT